MLLLGAFDLNDLFQTGALSGSPAEVFIHPDWNPFNQRYDADIAALVTEDEIPYTKYIRPICLPETDLVAREGYVTGWGESEDKSKEHENLPKQIKIPIVPNESCFLESAEFSKISSKRTICGGARDLIGPCRGDSGGGLFVKSGNVFYLKGLVSASLTNLGQCDVTNFALYTNVDKFIEWIENPTEELSVPQHSSASKPSYSQPKPSYSKPSYTQSSSKPSYTQSTSKPSYTQSSSKPSYTQSSSYMNALSSTKPPSYTNSPSRPSYTKAPFHTTASSFENYRPPVSKPISCGIMSTSKSLIQGGNQSSREQFPWTVATYVQGTYFSTGTLISDRHVISTGLSVASVDSITEEYIARDPSYFKMVFGVSDLDDPEASGFTVDGAAQIILHPNIKHGFPRIANVGILVLRTPVQFNKYISPACIPDKIIAIDEFEGRNVFAVGWGQTETGLDSKTKKYVAMKVRTQSDCEYFWSDNLKRAESSTFFCAGGDGHQSACYRDQPLYLKHDGKWILRGLISIAHNTHDNKCDLRQPVLYEDVGQYYNWIKTIIT